MSFQISSERIDRDASMREMEGVQSGGFVSFEGWVRNHNEGKPVTALEYEAFEELATKEGTKILAEAAVKFNVHRLECRHRVGRLELGEIAIWIGAAASHRDDAFRAARYVIDEVKHRLPIWKKEHYLGAEPAWVLCHHHHHHVHFHEHDFYQKQAKLVDQSRLKSSRVLVLGAGGLGCPALTSLAAAGVGSLTIVDFDRIDISNLHRQFLYTPNLVGEKKATVARTKILELNPFVKAEAVLEQLHEGNAEVLIAGHDLVLDCSDNMATKFLVHDACLKSGIPLVSASIFQHEGQLRTFDFRHGCLRCVTEKTPDDSLLGNCNDFGVLGAWVATLGSMQAAQAVEFLLHGDNSTTAETLLFDFRTLHRLALKNLAREGCAHCGGHFSLEKDPSEVSLDEFPAEESLLVDIREHTNDSYLDQFRGHPKKILVSCHRGVRSRRLVKRYREAGHTNFYSVRGGAAAL